jgi:hypothetical protein
MSKRYREDPRGRLGEIRLDLSNMAARAILFSQAISDKPFDLRLATIGVIVIAGL